MEEKSRSQIRLEQIARSGEIAKRILENKKAIDALPKNKIDLMPSTDRYYHEFGNHDDGQAYYDLIKDTRVENDPAYKRFCCILWFTTPQSPINGDSSRKVKELLREDTSFRYLNLGPYSYNNSLFERFREKLNSRQLNEEGYDLILYSRPSKLFTYLISKTFNKDYKMNPEFAEIIDGKWEKKYGKDWKENL